MSTNSQSILTTVKKTLGLAEDYTFFDPDVILHINSSFGTLHQLGIGPVNGFEIEDNTAVWSDFIGEDLTLSSVKQYIYYTVRLAFDPPTFGPLLDAIHEKIRELEWRLNVVREDQLLDATPEEV